MSAMSKITPMLNQYWEIKKQHKDCLLFFRLGDFYEMFGDDAKLGSKLLDITLTARHKGESYRIPMCGVPAHAADNYIAKLVKAGYRVAICEQVEDPKTAKGIVKREVIQIITPGTITNQALLEEKTNQYIVSIIPAEHGLGFALVDLTTGEFAASELASLADLQNQISLLQPKEIILPEFVENTSSLYKLVKETSDFIHIFAQAAFFYEYQHAYQTLLEHFKTSSLHGFGLEEKKLATQAAGALLYYLQETQKSALAHLTQVRWLDVSGSMILDQHTIESLEIFYSLQTRKKQGSLLAVLDQTTTACGGRLLRNLIAKPLMDKNTIVERQEAVAFFYEQNQLCTTIREQLNQIADLERLLARLSTPRGTALDLRALAQSFAPIRSIKKSLHTTPSLLINHLIETIKIPEEVENLIEHAIVPEPPAVTNKGGMIATGFNPTLDQLRSSRSHGKEWIKNLQKTERERTGIASLKVGYNHVFGYYLEVSKPNLNRVPEHYIRKQTLVNCERFITPELKEHEATILGAEERIINLEQELFQGIVDHVMQHLVAIQQIANALAFLDVFTTLAHLATINRYIRPTMSEENSILIKQGRHPVVEQSLSAGSFIPNDTFLNSTTDQIIILTGPNMAGKSTYIRQVALLVLMAQIGSFIPAQEATIGIVDRIFTRIGTADNLASGQSTFMVEMQETANILNNFSDKSLIILDEVGRGTSTVDGLSIAWAVVEYLHGVEKQGPRTLFATHYHELITMAESLSRVKNYNIAVKEEKNSVVFLHHVIPGGLDRSYGIHVAKLAGIPPALLSRAQELLEQLTSNQKQTSQLKPQPLDPHKTQLPLFTLDPEIVRELKDLDINQLSPLDALNKLNEIKKKL